MLINNTNRKEDLNMSTKLLHGQMSVVDENGDVTVLHQETSASDVLINNTTNTNIPADSDTLQKVVDKMGAMAFRSEDYVYLEESEETDVELPESEINDNVTGTDSTWSSQKIEAAIQNAINARDTNQIFFIPLTQNEDNFTTDVTTEEIENAYNSHKAIWVIADGGVFLPLRLRVNANKWVFSGYISNDTHTATQAYDITISDTGVVFTYHELVTAEQIKVIPTDEIAALFDEEEDT
jgi:hypothetical protein